MAVHRLAFLGFFLTISPLPVRWCHFNNFDAACQVMSGSCVGLSSSFFRASESNARQFFDGWFWLVGLESCWGFPVSDACWTVPLGAPKFNPSEAEAVSPWPATAWFSSVFLAISPLPVRWCQAVALAFLHLSLGRQTATSGTFSTDGFGWLGLNPAGVCLFIVTTSNLNEAHRSSSLFRYVTSLPIRLLDMLSH